MRTVVILLFAAAGMFCGAVAEAQDGLGQIKANYRTMLLSRHGGSDSLSMGLREIEPEREVSDQMVAELHERYPFDLTKIETYLRLLRDDGSWSDIDYADTKRSGWEPKYHVERLLELAELYLSTDSLQRLRQPLFAALDFWLREKPKSLNWWYNEIGVPKTLGAVLILLEDQLTAAQKEEGVQVMRQAKMGRTGQNKVWLAGNVLLRALLEDDAALVKEARDAIASEITVSEGEGIQADWSFHQHGPQQQFGNYGMAYLSGMSFFVRLFAGTQFAFGDEQMEILRSLVDHGYRWIIWNRHMDVSSLGRQLFHNAQIHKGYVTAFACADLGMGGFPLTGNPQVGHKHFWRSDFTVHRAPTWMCSLKMSSERVIGTELVNEDNLKGYYMGDGATFYYKRGDEYQNIFPLWNWRRIPGITAFADTAQVPRYRKTLSDNHSRKVGGLTVGRSGMSVMELNRDGLHAHKAWLMTDDMVLCLGSGIESDSALHVITTIDQRLAEDELLALGRDSMSFVHGDIGYVVLDKGGARLQAGVEERSGQWHDHMKMYRPAQVCGRIASLWLDHGIRPRNARYAYCVFPDCPQPQRAAKQLRRNVRILCNEPDLQAIAIKKGSETLCWIAAYEPATLRFAGRTYTIDTPGIYCIKRDEKQLMTVAEIKM